VSADIGSMQLSAGQQSSIPASRAGGTGEASHWRRGNPLGNPGLNLAARCGARARRTGCACRAPAMANGRCRMHGGCSTGPRTPEGMARMTAAHTTHGESRAWMRVVARYVWTSTTRGRLLNEVLRLRGFLPAAMVVLFAEGPAALLQPPRPDARVLENMNATPCNSLPGAGPASGRAGGKLRHRVSGREMERLAMLAEKASQAPWREAVAFARAAKREARRERGAAREAARAAAREAVRAAARSRRAAGVAARVGRVQVGRTATLAELVATRVARMLDGEGGTPVACHEPMQLSAGVGAGGVGAGGVGAGGVGAGGVGLVGPVVMRWVWWLRRRPHPRRCAARPLPR
jgi:hypothetical protein